MHCAASHRRPNRRLRLRLPPPPRTARALPAVVTLLQPSAPEPHAKSAACNGITCSRSTSSTSCRSMASFILAAIARIARFLSPSLRFSSRSASASWNSSPSYKCSCLGVSMRCGRAPPRGVWLRPCINSLGECLSLLSRGAFAGFGTCACRSTFHRRFRYVDLIAGWAVTLL